MYPCVAVPGGGNYRDEQCAGGGGARAAWAAAWKRGCVARLKGQTLTKIRERLHQAEIEMTARGKCGNYFHFMVVQLGNGTKRNDENNPTGKACNINQKKKK